MLPGVEGRRIFKKISITWPHLPTWLLLVGYPVYWLELYVFSSPRGQTSGLAAWLFIAVGFFAVRDFWCAVPRLWVKGQGFWTRADSYSKVCLGGAGILTLGILGCAFYAATFPPHLTQEFDVVNYHITIPRQHLIRHSFSHLPWSTADLYLLPVDFALAPFWLATTLPNKFPQFLFALGLLAVTAKLVTRLNPRNIPGAVMVVLAVMGAHSFGIQLGTGMLDIVYAYLFVAALESWLAGKVWLAAVEAAFYFWSKSFVPLQTLGVMLILAGVFLIFKLAGRGRAVWAYSSEGSAGIKYSSDLMRKFVLGFLLSSIFIGGPFVGKSLYYSGSPLFPFAVGAFPFKPLAKQGPAARASLVQKAKECVGVKEAYGTGRSLKNFLLHFWFLAVPEKDVNNRFDYPVGLTYLLFLGPFLYGLFVAIHRREFPVLPLLVCFFWALWWLGSQQSRFLFVPIILLFVCVASTEKFFSRVLLTVMVLALALTAISVVRAHQTDFGKRRYDVLRERDRRLLEMGKNVDRKSPVVLDFYDVAFADFAVDVRNQDSIFVIKTDVP